MASGQINGQILGHGICHYAHVTYAQLGKIFLPISTIESAVGKCLITHCRVSRLACSRLSGHIEPHLPDFKCEINTTMTVMN